MSQPENILHIALTGDKITRDWELIQELKLSYPVTLINQEQLAADNSLLGLMSAIIIDCTDHPDIETHLLPVLKKWKKGLPELNIVLVDGGLTPEQIALAFHEGARDYFPHPYDAKLLADRIKFLAMRKK
jgi:DNA-binding NtrC family response regulator